MREKELILLHLLILWYTDSFIIDIYISRILDKTCVPGLNHMVCFPTEVFLWMEIRDKNFVQKQLAGTIARSSDGDTQTNFAASPHA